MAFTEPNYNLVAGVYRGPWATKTLSDSAMPCNLAYSRRSSKAEVSENADSFAMLMSLLVPAGSDLRDLSCAAVQDVVEVPEGSGRWYQVCNVDDIGKGFPNEHRCAMLFKISEAMFGASYAGLVWPAPIP